MKRFALTSLLLLSVAVFFFSSVLTRADDVPVSPPKRLLVAHRGLSGIFPENTLLAIKATIAYGGNSAEIDVHRTSDGVIVLMHDGNLKRTTGLDADVTKTTFETIQTLDAGAWKGKQFAGEKVPTLEEALILMKECDCTPIIEMKQDGLEKDIVELLKRLELLDEAFVISFSIDQLKNVRNIEPRIKTVPIIFNQIKVKGNPVDQAEEFAAHFMEQADKVGTKYITANRRYYSPELVDILHKKGYYLWSGVGNSIPEIQRFLGLNRTHDGLTTDRVDLLSELLKECEKHGKIKKP